MSQKGFLLLTIFVSICEVLILAVSLKYTEVEAPTCDRWPVGEDAVQVRHGRVPVLVGAADLRCRLADAGGLLLRLRQRLGERLLVRVAQTSEVHAERLGEGSEGPRGPRGRHCTT